MGMSRCSPRNRLNKAVFALINFSQTIPGCREAKDEWSKHSPYHPVCPSRDSFIANTCLQSEGNIGKDWSFVFPLIQNGAWISRVIIDFKGMSDGDAVIYIREICQEYPIARSSCTGSRFLYKPYFCLATWDFCSGPKYILLRGWKRRQGLIIRLSADPEWRMDIACYHWLQGHVRRSRCDIYSWNMPRISCCLLVVHWFEISIQAIFLPGDMGFLLRTKVHFIAWLKAPARTHYVNKLGPKIVCVRNSVLSNLNMIVISLAIPHSGGASFRCLDTQKATNLRDDLSHGIVGSVLVKRPKNHKYRFEK
jgi:hypothetical protein